MAVHLARHHSLRSRSTSAAAKTMRTCKMKRLIDFIEENLDRDLSLEAMAVKAEMSPSLFAPRLQGCCGRVSYQYVLPSAVFRRRGAC